MSKMGFSPSRAAEQAGVRASVRALVSITAVLTAWSAQAVGLGEVRVESRLGEPLMAEVSLATSDRGTLQVKAAPSSAYAQHGLEAPSNLGHISTSVVRRSDGRQVLRITSTAPVNEPIVQLLVQASDESGHLDRQLTVLVSPARPGGGGTRNVYASRRGASVAVRDAASRLSDRARHADGTPTARKGRHKKPKRKTPSVKAHSGRPIAPAAIHSGQVAPVATGTKAADSGASKGPAALLAAAGANTHEQAQIAKKVADSGTNAAASPVTKDSANVTALQGDAEARASDSAGEARSDDAASSAPTSDPPDATVEGSSGGKHDSNVVESAAEPSDRRGRWEIAFAALLALALGSGWALRRRRTVTHSAAGDRHGLEPSQPAEVAVDAAHTGSPSGPDASHAVPEADALVQADAYLSAGRIHEACKVLEDGLQEGRDQVALLVKLLAIHGECADIDRFNESATHLAALIRRDIGAWQQACRMGRQLDPSNPLFAAPDEAATGGPTDAEDVAVAPQPISEALRVVAGTVGAADLRAAATLPSFALEQPTDTAEKIPPSDGGALRVVAPADHPEAAPTHARAATDDDDRARHVPEDPVAAEDAFGVDFELADLTGADSRVAGRSMPTETQPEPLRGFDGAVNPTRHIEDDAHASKQPQTTLSDAGIPSVAAEPGQFDALPALLERANGLMDQGDRRRANELAQQASALLALLREQAASLAEAAGECV